MSYARQPFYPQKISTFWPIFSLKHFVALIVPVFLAGCGGSISSNYQAPPATSGTGGSSPSSGGSSPSSGSSGSSSTSGSSGSSVTSKTNGTVISDIQTSSGNWQTWGQPPPYTADCNISPCNGVFWAMNYGITSPSLSGNATQFKIGGTTSYADALFSAQLIGQNSPQMRDVSHALLPTINNFTYDVDFYVTDATITQVLEFDISMYMNGVGMIWGTQCNHLGDKNWDIWDNANKKWDSAGVPCTFVNGWNHATMQFSRGTNNSLLYQSIELNGTTYTLNATYPPGVAPASWWGITANYQMDGNSRESTNITYLDNFSVTYW